MKSTLFNMVAVLFGITLVASAGVGSKGFHVAPPTGSVDRNLADTLELAFLNRRSPHGERG